MNIPLNIVEQIHKNLDDSRKWIIDNLCVLHIAGSRLYGTNTESSDIDVRGVTIAPKEYWIGRKRFEQLEIPSDSDLGMDIVIYDIRKWFQMAIKMNPNVVETLFVTEDSECTLEWNHIWDRVHHSKDIFLNKGCYDSYMGYSTSQYKKMIIKRENKTGRQELVSENGYDTKFAAHALRLTRQGAELLKTGNIVFPRPDAEELLQIRNGLKYKNDLDSMLEYIEKEQQNLKLALVESKLPDSGDYESLSQLQMQIYDNWIHDGV